MNPGSRLDPGCLSKKTSGALEHICEYSVSISALHDLLYLLYFLCLGLLVEISDCSPWKDTDRVLSLSRKSPSGYLLCVVLSIGKSVMMWILIDM